MPAPAIRSRVLSLLALCLVFTTDFGAQSPRANPDLTAHEWGTFTSIAGRDGLAMKWSTLRGSAELPSFVEHLNGAQFKAGLRGRVRMETPVLYFYSPQETTVSVKVKFSKGVITEWYPQASHVEPDPAKFIAPDALFHSRRSGSIEWNSVTVSPNLAASFPHGNQPGDDEPNQNYAARETSAAPLVVDARRRATEKRSAGKISLLSRRLRVFPADFSDGFAARTDPDKKPRPRRNPQRDSIRAPRRQTWISFRRRATEPDETRPSRTDRDLRVVKPRSSRHFNQSRSLSGRSSRHDRNLAAIVV